jgi:hypothetical protein
MAAISKKRTLDSFFTSASKKARPTEASNDDASHNINPQGSTNEDAVSYNSFGIQATAIQNFE